MIPRDAISIQLYLDAVTIIFYSFTILNYTYFHYCHILYLLFIKFSIVVNGFHFAAEDSARLVIGSTKC